MIEDRSITERFVGFFVLGCFLFSFPVLTLFNLDGELFGIPLLFFYLFCTWFVVIVLIALNTGSVKQAKKQKPPELPK